MSIDDPRFPWTRDPSPPVLYVWLHLPTGAAGAAGASEIWALPGGTPTAGSGTRLLRPDTPAPDETERPWSARTTADVDRALAEHGWQTVARGQARGALAIRFGHVRQDGILEAVQGDGTIWQHSEFAAVAFALRATAGAAADTRPHPASGGRL
ncbi:hypothetical protein [Kitasatospora griseola]|uniref:hypothetical protein n=1 Tax=Kitasatospora griseola TaxID=2064 RepID=UPI0034357B22